MTTSIRVAHALVLGGGLAGTLAAKVLSHHADTVTVVDRDRLPSALSGRKGTPQARHTHLLMSGGARALEDLLPGLVGKLLEAGAHRLGMPNDVLISSARGWSRRYDEMQFLISCSRALLDLVIQQEVSRYAIDFIESADVVGLLGEAGRITGAVVTDRSTRTTSRLTADIVVDATGRSSKAPQWLAELDFPPVHEDVVDPGIVYTTRIYQAPNDAAKQYPGISIQPDPHSATPGAGGVLIPIEDGQWMVTVAGMRGAEPPTDIKGFEEFARHLRHPIIADLIATAQPITPPYGFHAPPNRRRHFDRLKPWPHGLVVLGDAYCTFNPIYGHGMTAAINSVIALRDGMRHSSPNFVDIQRQIAKAAKRAWAMAISQDTRYPNTTGASQGRIARLQQRYLDRLARAAVGRPSVARATLDVYTLSTGPLRLISPRVVFDAIRGPGQPDLQNPPLSPAETLLTQSDN